MPSSQLAHADCKTRLSAVLTFGTAAVANFAYYGRIAADKLLINGLCSLAGWAAPTTYTFLGGCTIPGAIIGAAVGLYSAWGASKGENYKNQLAQPDSGTASAPLLKTTEESKTPSAKKVESASAPADCIVTMPPDTTPSTSIQQSPPQNTSKDNGVDSDLAKKKEQTPPPSMVKKAEKETQLTTQQKLILPGFLLDGIADNAGPSSFVFEITGLDNAAYLDAVSATWGLICALGDLRTCKNNMITANQLLKGEVPALHLVDGQKPDWLTLVNAVGNGPGDLISTGYLCGSIMDNGVCWAMELAGKQLDVVWAGLTWVGLAFGSFGLWSAIGSTRHHLILNTEFQAPRAMATPVQTTPNTTPQSSSWLRTLFRWGDSMSHIGEFAGAFKYIPAVIANTEERLPRGAKLLTDSACVFFGWKGSEATRRSCNRYVNSHYERQTQPNEPAANYQQLKQ